jgi:peptidyl-prolyl cis-trans isomerase SurA
MKNRTLRSVTSLFALILLAQMMYGQEQMIDQVVAVVGGNVIFQSDIENQYLQMRAQGYYSNLQGLKCEIFEELLTQKLFLTQAQIDSIVVEDSNVDAELDRRLKVFINQIGTEAKLEEYYRKSMYEIKADFRDIIRDQMLTQKMQVQLTGDIKITPSEVRSYFRQLPADSIPGVPLQYELRQIVKKPKIDESEIFRVKEQLLNLRKRVLDGENFSTLAVLYSEDKASAVRGGDLGYVSRSDLVKPFADAAFSLKQNQVSNIVESEYGYHIIQMLDRRNDQIDVRHILIKPKSSPDAIKHVENQLDSLLIRIKSDSLDFSKAALFLSDDQDTRLNGGLMVNPNTGTARFEAGDLDRATLAAIRDLKEGEYTSPFRTVNENGQEVYKVIRVEKIIPAHKANLEEDYSLLQNLALNNKKLQIIQDWIIEKQKTTYIRIDDSLKSCPFKTGSWIK